jgi:ribosomal protein S27E
VIEQKPSERRDPMEKWFKNRSRDVKMNCALCGHEINLDHKVFENYSGPVKCFACSAILEVGTEKGFVYSIKPLDNVNPNCVSAAR